MSSGNERVELGRDIAELGVDWAHSLIGDLVNVSSCHRNCNRIAFKDNIHAIILVISLSGGVFRLGQLNSSSCCLLQRLDGSTLLANDVSSRRTWNGDRAIGLYAG